MPPQLYSSFSKYKLLNELYTRYFRGAVMHRGADGLGGALTAANCQDENGCTKYGHDGVFKKTERLAVEEKR